MTSSLSQTVLVAPAARNLEAGFTLIELMVVVAIVAILASVALPYYNYYVIRGNIAEAVSTLSSERVLLEQYYQDNGTYGTGGACALTMPTAGQVKYFTYTCAATSSTGGANDDGYVITATGNAAYSMTGFSYTIDNNNNRTSNLTAAGWSNPTPNNCWAVKKGGLC
jgi:type IV pilus assembly protein PilE